MRGLMILVLALLSPGLWGSEDHEHAYRLREQSEILPLEQIIGRLGLAPDDRILEVETEFEKDKRIYEIEYVTGEGRILEIEVDARTGDILERREE
jgi:uncharacterized membrane protein YkoI